MAAGDRHTARAGAVALRAGGNAVDAVCAAALTSFVCELPLTSPAGAGLVLHGTPDRGWSVLDFFARVPGLGAARPAPLDFFAVEVDFGPTTQEFHVGKGAAAVPGALRGLVELHRSHGRLPLSELVVPAYERAVAGYTAHDKLVSILRLLEPIYRVTSGAWSLVETNGAIPEPGDCLRSPGQAHLLEMLGRDPDQTLRALEADLVAAFGPSEGGLITPDDLERFRPVSRAPLSVEFSGHTVLTPPPPSSGGGLISLGLRVADRGELAADGFGAHWVGLAEVLRAVSRARADGYDIGLARPDFLTALLSDDGVDEAMRRAEELAERSLGSTTHVSVLDDHGGAASMTCSNGEGCGHVLSPWGVHVNNFLGEEDINPGGFHALPAGTSMPTMMAPTIVLDGRTPRLVLGSGGSNRLRSAILQVLINHLGFGRPLAESVAADRLHVEGARLWLESTGYLTGPRLDAVEARWPGATRFERPSMFFGGVHAAALSSGRFTGIGDARRAGAVATPDEV